jgi:hypothetical protein
MPDGKELPGLYFNLKALGGYLLWNEKRGGFECRQHDVLKRPGFFAVNPDLAENILDGFGRDKAVIRIGDHLIDIGSLDNAYYDPDKKLIKFVLGREIRQVAASPAIAGEVLLRLKQEKGFTAFVAEDSKSASEVPMDVVHTERATLVWHNPAEAKTHIAAEETPFFIRLGGDPARAFLKDIEAEGRAASGPALPSLPPLSMKDARAFPIVSADVPQVLLSRLLKKKTGHEAQAEKKMIDKKKPLSPKP